MSVKLHYLYALTFSLGLFSCSNPSKEVQQEKELPEVQITPVNRVSNANIRGLFLLNDSVGWASGSNGTFLRMTNGTTWVSDTISGYTHLDFRDVHAFDKNTAILLSSGKEGRILRTEDGGKIWNEVYTNLEEGIFLDGFDFEGSIGYCYGDPINGKFFILKSENRGENWGSIEPNKLPNALPNEAGFAASGTGILTLEKMKLIATGGDSLARILRTSFEQDISKFFETPIRSGEGCGIFSIAQAESTIVAVGGCYLDSMNVTANCAIFNDWGETWNLITQNQPRGYRSCVAYTENSAFLVACGRTGIDISYNLGRSWEPVSNEGYYTCCLADSTGWLMGKRGKMARLSW